MDCAENFRHLYQAFRASVGRYPKRPALEIGAQSFTYAELDERATGLAAAIVQHDPCRPVAAFLAYRSLSAYTAVLGILASGKGYVPLHPAFPGARTRRMLELSGAETLIVGSEGIPALHELLCGLEQALSIVCPDLEDTGDLQARYPQHRFIAASECRAVSPYTTPDVGLDATAYVLFTSGSTGMPKGVAISQRNVTSYVDYVSTRYGISPEDRFSQTFDMTFDLSVHDMFVCWTNGACLCSVPQAALTGPARFIQNKRVSAWFSVPSVIMFMHRMKLLKPGSFPTLRLSLFCGEPLPAALADAWQQAAPNSVIENLYGPTEATIAISHYRWQPGVSVAQSVNGIVPIGEIFDGQQGCVIDRDHSILPQGEAGELCLGGSQVAGGYLNNPQKTAEQFVHLAGQAGVWYRTGDLVRQGEDGCFYYLGRIDNQVQVRGYRVELQEVDHALREAARTELAISVAWPLDAGRADAVYGFVCAEDADKGRIKAHCQKTMPEYMVPREIFVIDDMPLNVNGKIDRQALARRVGELLNER